MASLAAGLRAQAAPSPAAALLNQATAAEAAYQLDLAAARWYQLVLEHPRTPEARSARPRLARLLALAGELPAAMLHCQATREEDAASTPAERQAALNLATILARRLRGGAGAPAYYARMEIPPVRGLTTLNEPTAIEVEASGALLLTDRGARRVYRIRTESATLLPGTTQPTAATGLPDGAVMAADRNGFVSSVTNKPTAFAGTWGGKTRPLRRVRSLAANSRGDLFVVDEDYTGVLRCKAGAAACGPWGPAGKVRAVKVGASDFVYLLDDRQQSVRVVDDGGRQLALAGVMIGAARLEKIGDIAVDAAYGLYLLDPELRRVQLLSLRAGPGNQFALAPIGSVTIPTEGDRALRNPSAIGVTSDGALIVAGRSSSRLLRFQ